jgi:hypothetical protein
MIIPMSVIKIGKSAFQECSKLKSVIFAKHTLCANPAAATKDMIKQLFKNTEAVSVRNVNDMLPCHIMHDVVSKDRRFRIFNEIEDGYDRIINITMTDTARMIFSNDFDADKLVEADLEIDVMEMYLKVTTGSPLVEGLETANAVTGLYPLMSMAKSNCSNLEEVHNVAMMNLKSTLQRQLITSKKYKL